MKTIQDLAREVGFSIEPETNQIYLYDGGGFRFDITVKLEAFAKSLQQRSEPMAYVISIPKNADEAEAVQKLAYAWLKDNAPDRLTNAPQPSSEPVSGVVVREDYPTLLHGKYIKPTDIRLYTQPPNTVSLEQYNKLLVWVKLLGVEVEKLGITLTIEGKNFKQAIAEAERSAK